MAETARSRDTIDYIAWKHANATGIPKQKLGRYLQYLRAVEADMQKRLGQNPAEPIAEDA